MASIRPHGKRWRVFIDKRGVKKSKVFDTKAQAVAWANDTEESIKRGNIHQHSDRTLEQAIEHYLNTVTPWKGSSRTETSRLMSFVRDYPKIAQKRLDELTRTDFLGWKESRLKKVKGSSLSREMTIMGQVLKKCVEWEWLDSSPMAGISQPAEPPPRDRLHTEHEKEALLIALGHTESTPNGTSQGVAYAWLFALETGMRAQEICNLTWDAVSEKTVTVRASKTRSGIRGVPLTKEARRILEVMRGVDDTFVFKMNTSSLDALFRKAKKKAGIVDLTFHDSRHYAITQLAKKLSVLELARAVGHKNLAQLHVYYNETAENLADKLE